MFVIYVAFLFSLNNSLLISQLTAFLTSSLSVKMVRSGLIHELISRTKLIAGAPTKSIQDEVDPPKKRQTKKKLAGAPKQKKIAATSFLNDIVTNTVNITDTNAQSNSNTNTLYLVKEYVVSSRSIRECSR